MNLLGLTKRTWFEPILLAPLIFICHFLEESPTFVTWFNSHVARGITSELFWRVNLTALVITLTITAFEWFSRSEVSIVLVSAWFGFLMFANAIFHITGAFVDRSYVPGLVTAVLLYLPFCTWLLVSALRNKRASLMVLLLAEVIGGIPMFVHGYLILFRGSRLF
jgi:hypothetical protein